MNLSNTTKLHSYMNLTQPFALFMKAILIFFLFFSTTIIFAENNAPITIVQAFGWHWDDIRQECSFFHEEGVSAVLIDPVSEEVFYKAMPWWSLYQPVSYKLSSLYGDLDSLKSMIKTCHLNGVKVYTGIVVRHMATYKNFPTQIPHVGVNGTRFNLFSYTLTNESTEKINYNYDDFLHLGIIKRSYDSNLDIYQNNSRRINCPLQDKDFHENEWKMRNCDLVGLPTLNYSSANTINNLRKNIITLLSLGVDGFFVDASRHLYPEQLATILSGLYTMDNNRPFIFYEMPTPFMIRALDPVNYDEYYKLSQVTGQEVKITGHNFAKLMYQVFQDNADNNFNNLINYSGKPTFDQANFPPKYFDNRISLANILKNSPDYYLTYFGTNHLITMIANHDTENSDAFKALKAEDGLLPGGNTNYALANAFMLAIPYGTPLVLSSNHIGESFPYNALPITNVWNNNKNECFKKNSPWLCQHRWPLIANMIRFRKNTVAYQKTCNLYLNGNQVGFDRCNLQKKANGYFFINYTKNTLNAIVTSNLPTGCYPEIIHHQQMCVHNHKIQLNLGPYDALAIIQN